MFNADNTLYKIIAIQKKIKLKEQELTELQDELEAVGNSNLDKLLSMDTPSPTQERMNTISDIIQMYN